jgi:hypothetical protein
MAGVDPKQPSGIVHKSRINTPRFNRLGPMRLPWRKLDRNDRRIVSSNTICDHVDDFVPPAVVNFSVAGIGKRLLMQRHFLTRAVLVHEYPIAVHCGSRFFAQLGGLGFALTATGGPRKKHKR